MMYDLLVSAHARIPEFVFGRRFPFDFQINFNEAMRKTSEAKDKKIDELQKEIEALRKQQQHNGGNLSRYDCFLIHNP